MLTEPEYHHATALLAISTSATQVDAIEASRISRACSGDRLIAGATSWCMAVLTGTAAPWTRHWRRRHG